MIAYLLEEDRDMTDEPKLVGIAVSDLETAMDWCDNREYSREFVEILVSDVLDADQIDELLERKQKNEDLSDS